MQNENNDLISREALRKALHNFFDGKVIDEPAYILRDVFCHIDNAQPVEIATKLQQTQGEWGKWIIAEIQCPTCLRYFETDYYTKEELKKCPNCGAGMRNEESPQAEAVSDRYDEGFRDGYAQCINDKEERKENNRLFQKGGKE